MVFDLRSAQTAIASLVEFDSADGTSIVFLQPVYDAIAVEGMLAGQLAARWPVFALLETNVAISFSTFFLLG